MVGHSLPDKHARHTGQNNASSINQLECNVHLVITWEEPEQWSGNRRFIFLLPSSHASRKMPCSPRLAHKKSACYEGYLLSNFRDYFSKNEDIHNYHTRSASMVHTSYGKFSVEYRGAEIWNNLPDNFKNKMTSYSSFKYSVKSSIQMIHAIIPIC